MKIRLVILFLLFCGIAFSQIPAKFKQIHFTYEKKTNFIVNDNGVYADTTLFKMTFPKLKYSITRNPENINEVYGFAPFSFFGKEDKQKLRGSIYHANEILNGTYDAEKNILIINAVRNDKATDQMFRKYFGGDYQPFRYKIIIDYDKKTIERDFPSVNYKSEFSEAAKEITFSDEAQLMGLYEQKTKTIKMQNMVYLEEGIDKRVVPNCVFTNNNYGVRKIWTIYDTITLTSVSYD